MARHKLGWSLHKRGNNYFVYHRFSENNKLIGVTTGQNDYDLALRVAINIIDNARKNLADNYIPENSTELNIMEITAEQVKARKKAAIIKKQEEKLLLDNYTDSSNPRLIILWDFENDKGLYLDYLKNQDKTPLAIKKNKYILKDFFRYLLLNNIDRVKNIKDDHIIFFFDTIKNNIKMNTLRTRYSAICSFFNYLKSEHNIIINMPKLSVKIKHEQTSIDKVIISDDQYDQAVKLLSEIDFEFFKFFILGYHTGMRKSEINNLLWSNIKLNDPKPHIRVRENNIDVENNISRSTLKTVKSHRTIPIRSQLLPFLKLWFENKENNQYVINIKSNRNHFNFSKINTNKLKKIIPNYHHHLLRHTFISRALIVGKVPPVILAMVAGDNLNTILSTYAHYIDVGDFDNW